MQFKRINVVTPDNIYLADVVIKGNKISKIKKISNKPAASAKYMMPGFIDSHTHGGYGWDFNSLARNDLKKAKDYLNNLGSEGVTTVIGTTVTCSIKDLYAISKNWKKFNALDKEGLVKGWYIEGPFISKEKKGAHDETLICQINTKVLDTIKRENKFIKILAVAPEIKNNLELIKKVSKDYVVAIGHSACSADLALESLVNGASRIVHLYNQTSKFDHRNPGIVNMAFLDTPMNCELVSDGFHVNKLVLKNTYDIIKPDRIIIITDSLSCKGLPKGDYMLGTLNIHKFDDIARLKDDNTIAGSVKPYIEHLHTFLEATHCSLCELTKMSSYNAAKNLKLDNKLGIIKENYLADFVIVDSKLNLYETYKNGKLIYKK